ncbi:MAG: efflux RND transporter periplasmic adaptor subunit [Deltaproteobacteria bacterium]|nr:efflux RND transporter periplasmic adaptor subunit [Deltaproteobacteria bacterium]
MKKIVIAAVLVLLIVIGWQMYKRTGISSEQPAGRNNPVVAVETVPVARTVIREVGIFTGTLLPRSQFDVAPKIPGRLEKLFVNIGDPVKRGQLIALIDDDEYVQQVNQARAELDVAMANREETRSSLNLAEREYERAQALREKKILSESDLDAAEANYKVTLARQKVAEAQVVQKEAELKTAQVRLDYARIAVTWEVNGESRFVGERFVDEGAMLTANTPIASIIDISSLKAVIHVIERDYTRVRVGQPAIISTDAFPGRTFMGTIDRVAPLLKEAARQARVEIDVPNPEGVLKPGMFVRVDIEFDRHEDAVVVPVDSLVKNGNGWSLYLADLQTMKAVRVPVKVGIINGTAAEIVEPALSGFVIIVGQHLLEDGAAISLPGKTDETSS